MHWAFRSPLPGSWIIADQPQAKPNSDLYSTGFVMCQRESARIKIQMFCDVSDQG